MIEFVYPHTQLVAGVDEVGRGPLVGAVVTAAVILDPARPIAGLNDSKKLTPKKRDQLFDLICQNAVAFGIALGTVDEIKRRAGAERLEEAFVRLVREEATR